MIMNFLKFKEDTRFELIMVFFRKVKIKFKSNYYGCIDYFEGNT